MNKLLKCEGDGKEKVESILNKISQFRSRAQEVLTLVETDGAPSHWLEDDSDIFEVGETETAQENCVTKKVAGRTKVLRYNSNPITKSTAAFQLRKLRKEIYEKVTTGLDVKEDLKKYCSEVEVFVNTFKSNLTDKVVSIWKKKVKRLSLIVLKFLDNKLKML